TEAVRRGNGTRRRRSARNAARMCRGRPAGPPGVAGAADRPENRCPPGVTTRTATKGVPGGRVPRYFPTHERIDDRRGSVADREPGPAAVRLDAVVGGPSERTGRARRDLVRGVVLLSDPAGPAAAGAVSGEAAP